MIRLDGDAVREECWVLRLPELLRCLLRDLAALDIQRHPVEGHAPTERVRRRRGGADEQGRAGVIARHALHRWRLSRCDEEHDDGSREGTGNHDRPLAPDDLPVLARVHRAGRPFARSRDVLTLLPLDLLSTVVPLSTAPREQSTRESGSPYRTRSMP